MVHFMEFVKYSLRDEFSKWRRMFVLNAKKIVVWFLLLKKKILLQRESGV